jgi:hypothetical protein
VPCQTRPCRPDARVLTQMSRCAEAHSRWAPRSIHRQSQVTYMTALPWTWSISSTVTITDSLTLTAVRLDLLSTAP